MLQVAQITAGGSLHLDADSFIQSIGGLFGAGDEMTLLAGGDISILALQLASEHDFEFDGGFEHSSALINQLATLDAGGDLTMLAGGDLTLQGAELTAGADATLFALGDTTIESVQDFQHDEYQMQTESGGFLGMFRTGTNTHELDFELDTQRTTIDAGGDLTIVSGSGDLTLDTVSLDSAGDILLSAEQGTVALLSNTDQSVERDFERDEGLLWFTEEDQGHNEESIEHVTIEQEGELTIVAGDGVVVEYERVGSQQESLDRLVQSPELAWMQQLRDDPSVDWNGLDAAFEEWDYESQGLTATGAALVSLIVGVATGGTLSGAAASITNALSLGANVALQAGVQGAIQAGLTSLVNRAAVLLVNNLGDIGATLQQLAALETLTTLGTAMLTAGLTTGLTAAAGLGGELVSTAPLAERVAEDLQQSLISTAVDTGVSTLIEGEELGDALLSSLRAEAAGVLGENLAQEIGAAVDNGDLDTAGQLIAHAALGCATGLLAADDCPSAAAGAVIGEATAMIYTEHIEQWSTERLEDVLAGEVDPEEFLQDLDQMLAAGVDIARLTSGFTAALAGLDVNAAAQAGANAAQYNELSSVVAQFRERLVEHVTALIAAGEACTLACMQATAVIAPAFFAQVVLENVGASLGVIGRGEDPLSKALSAGIEGAVTLSYALFPQATADLLDDLEEISAAIDVTVTFLDEVTGSTVSRLWNELDPETQDRLKGGSQIVSLFIPGASVKTLRALKPTAKLPDVGDTPTTSNSLTEVATSFHTNPIPTNQIRDIRNISAADANAFFVSQGQSPPFAHGTVVTQFEAASDLDFVRVHIDSNPRGGWLVRRDEVVGMTPAQIQQRLALPQVPTQIQSVTVPPGTTLQMGRVGAQPQWGVSNSGGIQYYAVGRLPDSAFGPSSPL